MKPYLSLHLLLAAASVFSLGCGAPSVSEDPVVNADDPVVHVDGSNVEMKEAITTARKTFDQFVENWESMPNDSVSIKFALPTNDGELEHIWFEPTKITDTEITGICGNDPAKVDGLKYGDTRTFERSELTDWMILQGKKCYGGYTIRVLVKMEPENAPPLEFVDF